jgi:hypothetical protein
MLGNAVTTVGVALAVHPKVRTALAAMSTRTGHTADTCLRSRGAFLGAVGPHLPLADDAVERTWSGVTVSGLGVAAAVLATMSSFNLQAAGARMRSETTRQGTLGPGGPGVRDAVDGALESVAVDTLVLVCAGLASVLGVGFHNTTAGVAATAACRGAATPASPLVHHAVDGALMLVAILRILEVGTNVTTVVSVRDDTSVASLSALATSLGAVTPGSLPDTDLAVLRAWQITARSSLAEGRTWFTAIAGIGDNAAGALVSAILGFLGEAAADGAVTPSAPPSRHNAVNRACESVAGAGLGCCTAGDTTVGGSTCHVSAGLLDASAGATAASLAAAFPFAPDGLDAINRTREGVAIIVGGQDCTARAAMLRSSHDGPCVGSLAGATCLGACRPFAVAA